MNSPNSSKKGMLSGLARILHLHELPSKDPLPISTGTKMPLMREPIPPAGKKETPDLFEKNSPNETPVPVARESTSRPTTVMPPAREPLYPRYPDITNSRKTTPESRPETKITQPITLPPKKSFFSGFQKKSISPTISSSSSMEKKMTPISPVQNKPTSQRISSPRENPLPQTNNNSTTSPAPIVTQDSPAKKIENTPPATGTRPVVSVSTTPTPTPTPTPAPAHVSPPASSMPSPVSAPTIITEYDRILELVKQHDSIKLDEVARLLKVKEEKIVQELQTLEDNGLVEIRYPAFGEPLIVFKKKAN